jgi:NADPH:quinone reductase
MEAMVVSQYGAPEVMLHEERPDLRPGSGEVVVDVAVAGVNMMDSYLRQGFPLEIPLPFIPGVDGSGLVTAVGEAVTRVSVGDRVAWQRHMGSYASQIAIDAGLVVIVPKPVSLEAAAAVLMQGLTAHHLAHVALDCGPGQTAIVHSAASGVGRMLTQILARRGATVIATVSTAQKAAVAQAAGAAHVVVRNDEDLAGRVRELTGGRGADVVYDGVGGPSFDAGLACLAYGGTFAHFGRAGGPIPPIDLWSMPDGVRLLRVQGSPPHETADEMQSRAAQLMSQIERGDLDALVGGRYPLAEAGRAHADLESQATTGKLLLIP